MRESRHSRGLAAALAGLLAVLLAGCQPAESQEAAPDPAMRPDAETGGQQSLQSLRARHAALARQLAHLAPDGTYIVVDTARNQLYIKRQGRVLLEALASTGSGTILQVPDRPQTRWVFDTPRGEFAVQSRLYNPVWVKPDWAFLEEGLAVPTDPDDRLEPGTLGDYAVGFGNGYFIHGTLYPRLLGKNVTHGCIRLNDEDLRLTFRLASIGTPILIF